jgi:hypothetical protein
MATAIPGGLVNSTLRNLFVVPAFAYNLEVTGNISVLETTLWFFHQV